MNPRGADERRHEGLESRLDGVDAALQPIEPTGELGDHPAVEQARGREHCGYRGDQGQGFHDPSMIPTPHLGRRARCGTRSAPAPSELARSRRYGDIRKALLSADADRSLPPPASPHDWLAAGSPSTRACAGDGTAVPDGAADLVADLYRRMPEARITDILLEVDDATRFAEGINLGLR